ncbi:MAG: outer membrane protein assembly factor BamA [Deltaproteobacteria bacterium]|nr:outer membrane protein assembly factor BamA [Deltaproteobacteria bacterium]MBW2534093.1 outer membrane protein assembly factor BamA [Deltaproteobacteria bacterium]
MPPTEAERAEGERIAKVEVVGNKRVSKREIRSYLKWMRVGKAFSPDGVTRDVRELWESGYFDHIEVDLSRADDGSASLRIVVRERPSIEEITFTGNHELDEEDLTKVVAGEVKVGSIINHAAIRRAIQAIRDKYAEDGYFLAEVRYEVEPQQNNQIIVKFTIKEHEKVTVRRITFIGNHNISDDELREVMVTGKGGFFDFGKGGPFRQDAFERDVLVLSSLYYDRGYLSVQVAAPRVMLTPDRSGIDIVLSIDEGPRYRIRRLHLLEVDEDGQEIEPLGGRRKLREMIRARSGEFFNRAELVKDLSEIQTMYRDAGYANVEAPPQTQLYPDLRVVDIVIKLRRRSLVNFGRIEISGNTKTRDKVIRREMEIAEGKLFSETGLERSRRRITQLGYFERVDVSTEQGASPNTIDVNVEVVEKPTGTFQIGAGFSSIESFIATAQVQQANLFGRGQSLALMAQLSGLRQLIDIRFYEPYFLDSPFSMSVDLFDQLRVYDQFALDTMGASLTFGYPIIDPELRASLTYTIKDDQVDTTTTSTFFGTASAVSVFRRLPLSNLFQDGLTSSIRPALTYDTRNNRLFPTEGVYLQGSTEVAVGAFGSDNEYLRHRLIGRFYYPITRSIVLKFNAEAGLVTSPDVDCSTVDDTCGVPLFARFFLGGIFDLRGFRLRTVGPRLPLRSSLDENAPPIPDGANIGGNLMYFQNLEIEVPIVEAVGLRGVVFTDLGNAWNLEQVYCEAAPGAPNAVTDPCFDIERLLDVRTSWGFGLRWFSPLGPLRFEWGFPFSPLPYEESSVFEFTIGNFF